MTQPNMPASDGPIVPGSAGRRFWCFWFVALAGAVCIHLCTFHFSPPVGQDESQIVEYGRAVLQPWSDWSTNFVASGHPGVMFNYVGSLLQELAYRITTSHVGPRVSSMLGAAAAATMIVGWLLARGTERRFAWLLGAVFFLDPIFTPSFRSGRIDGLAMAPCLGAAWLLRSRIAMKHPLRCCCAAGGMAAAGSQLWPSAVLTFPLLLSELVVATLGRRRFAESLVQLLPRLAMLLVGAVSVSAVLLTPLLRELRNVVQMRSYYSAAYGSNSLGSNALAFVKVTARDPFVVLLALSGALRRPSRGLVLVVLAVLGWTLTMTVYTYRLVYLLPYVIGLSSCCFSAAARAATPLRGRRLPHVLLFACMAWAVGLSLGARTYVGIRESAKRDPLLLKQEVSRAIGSGPHKVYVVPYELYHSGRALGWKMFRLPRGSTQRSLLVESLLREVDHAILRAGDAGELSDDYLAQMGLRCSDSLSQSSSAQTKSLLGFNLGFAGYGPYIVYSRSGGTGSQTGTAETGSADE